MKDLKEILKVGEISDIEFHLDYYDMIEELFKHKTTPPKSFFEEKRLLEERLEELCLKSENKNHAICNLKLHNTKRL